MKKLFIFICNLMIFTILVTGCSSSSGVGGKQPSDGKESKINNDDSSDVLLDQDGVKIIRKEFENPDSEWGNGLEIQIENDSDKDINVQASEVIINGSYYTNNLAETVPAGKSVNAFIEIVDEDSEEDPLVEDVKDMEVQFTIYEDQTWEELLITDLISIHF